MSNAESYPCFSKHCSCHLQGEYVLAGHVWKSYIGQAIGSEWDDFFCLFLCCRRP
jgi:hypothetical protein